MATRWSRARNSLRKKARLWTDWLFGWSLLDNSDGDVEKGMAYVLTATAILIPMAGGLMTILKDQKPVDLIRAGEYEVRRLAPDDDPGSADPEPNWLVRNVGLNGVILIYLLASSLPLCVLCFVMKKSKYSRDGRRMHYFDVAGVGIGRLLIVPALLLVLGTALYAADRASPRAKVEIRKSVIAPYQFKNDQADGIVVNVSFAVTQLPKGANVIYFDVSLDDFIFGEWSVTDIQLSATEREPKPDGQAAEKPFVSFANDKIKEQQTSRLRVINAQVKDEYTLRFLMRPKEGKRPNRDAATEYLRKESNAFRLAPVDPTIKK